MDAQRIAQIVLGVVILVGSLTYGLFCVFAPRKIIASKPYLELQIDEDPSLERRLSRQCRAFGVLLVSVTVLAGLAFATKLFDL